ncbi:MAG: DUF928 domain-containing protein [Cyanobacteria bacterium J06649_5]
MPFNNPMSAPFSFSLIKSSLKASGVALVSACLFGPALAASALAAPALAETTILSPTPKAYRPPADNRPPRGPFIPGARRSGCQGLLHNGLTAIAPQQQVGQTISTQPTLTWFVSDDTAYDMALQLYEYSQDQWVKLSEVDLGPSQRGYSAYRLPETTPLKVGGLYRWQIILECDPARPSRNKVEIAQFEVVSAPANLDVASATSLAAAQQYAAAGFWYDAIALLIEDALPPAAITYRNTLLQTLAETESPNLSAQLLSIAGEK